MATEDLGIYMLIAIIAMAISMAITPIMMRYAVNLGMVDKPDSRKIHDVPIPRVGGIGLVIGSLIPMLIWLPGSDLMHSYIFGSVVLLAFGIWDDIKELGHYVKFIGQFIAVIAVVYYGGLYVEHFPYIGLDTIPESIGKPFTVIAIVGVINALNHSDGLDGLAGGESLLSFGAVGYLAYLYGGLDVLVISCAVIGGIFGFLRFNSYPAKVFMGDGGSQFIGFTLGFLVVLLTQEVNPVFSPALPLLLIGLPIVDILAVFFLRAKGKSNLFKATRNHIHHRLLAIGFYHYESVMIIYSVQAFLVICGILMPYESDFLITGIYLFTCGIVFTGLTLAERKNYRAHRKQTETHEEVILPRYLSSKNIIALPGQVMEAGIMIFLVGSALITEAVPVDIGILGLVLLVILLLLISFTRLSNFFIYRLVMFVSIGFAVYLSTSYPPSWLTEQQYLVLLYYAVFIAAVFIVARMVPNTRFSITPLDYLVVIIALTVAIVTSDGNSHSGITWMALQMIILFYACELMIQHLNSVRNRISGAMVAMLLIIATRGIL